VNGHAAARGQDVLADEARAARELNGVAVEQDLAPAELLGELGVERERARGPVDVELRVRPRVAAVGHREVEQRVAVAVDDPAHRAEQLPALAVGHRAQRGAALFPRERERGSEVDALGRGVGERLLVRRVDQGLRLAFAFDPRARDVAG
jgi:hypothetical protein